MTTVLKGPEGMKDSECKKGQLSSPPPITYVPLADLVTTKESSDNLKVKLEDGTVFNMTIFSQGNTEEYLAHVIALLHLINQKGINVHCRRLAKSVDKLAGTQANLQKSIGPSGLNSKQELEAFKVEVIHVQETLKEAWKAHNETTAKMYKFLRNLVLSSNPQTHWDWICCKMPECDSWAGVDGQVTTGRCPHLWTAFQDCLELCKLIVFTADVAKRQRYYIPQAVRKSQKATVRQHILQMGVLNDYVRYLPRLKDSLKAVPTTK
jgi:hypothetical protein